MQDWYHHTQVGLKLRTGHADFPWSLSELLGLAAFPPWQPEREEQQLLCCERAVCYVLCPTRLSSRNRELFIEANTAADKLSMNLPAIQMMKEFFGCSDFYYECQYLNPNY